VTLSLLFLTAVPATASTYYVSQSGNDANSCATATTTNQANNKRTIAAGVACLSAGDMLRIRGGTYTGAADRIDSEATTIRSGTSFSNAVTIAGYPGETVTIKPPDNHNGIRMSQTGPPRYVIIQDLIIDMDNSTLSGSQNGADGVYIGYGANHIRLQRLEIKNNSANGIQMSDTNGNSPFNEVLQCSIHTNGQSLDPSHGAGGVHNGYGMYISTSDNLFDGNEIYDNGGYGAHFYDNDGALHVDRNVIRNNSWHDNGTHGGSNFAFLIAAGDGNQVYNNLVYSNPGGISIYTGAKNTLLAHNTIYRNGPEPGLGFQYQGTGTIVRNNISYDNADNFLDYGGGTGPITADHNLFTNPAFANAGAGDFRLTAGSAAIDAGVTLAPLTTDHAGDTRPFGGTSDIGAFEFGSTGAPAVQAPTNLRLKTP
jgi:serralysin